MKNNLISAGILWVIFSQVALMAQSTVEVLRPNSQDRLQAGTTFRVEWRAHILQSNVDWSFVLYTNNVNPRFVTPGPEAIFNDGDGNWHADVAIPSDLPSGCEYTLLVNEDVTEAHDYSDVFCLGMPLVNLRVSQVEVYWASRSNRVYQVQYRSTLTTNLWTNLGDPVQGNGLTNCVTDAVILGQPQRYYRVVELP